MIGTFLLLLVLSIRTSVRGAAAVEVVVEVVVVVTVVVVDAVVVVTRVVVVSSEPVVECVTTSVTVTSSPVVFSVAGKVLETVVVETAPSVVVSMVSLAFIPVESV